MANSVGQIVYNLQTQAGVVSSSQTSWQTQTTNPADRINIYEDILKNKFTISKLGVQGPAGATMIINDKRIMIGRTGIYELDEGIPITTLKFEKRVKVQYSEELSKEAINNGKAQMQTAETARKAAIAALDESASDYWDKYIEIQNTYIIAYTKGKELYEKGLRGVYTQVQGEYEDFENIIIDFVYSEVKTNG